MNNFILRTRSRITQVLLPSITQKEVTSIRPLLVALHRSTFAPLGRRNFAEAVRGSMAESLKIHYFDEAGRAEVSRLVLVWAGKPFEDVRISFESWPQIQPSMPLKQVPVLEMDGKMYPQSLAIAAFLAREYGLHGASNLESLKIDVIAQTVFELRIKASRHYYEKDAGKKAEIAEQLTNVEAPWYLDFLEKRLSENGGDTMVGETVTLADLIVYDLVKEGLGKFVQPHLGKYPGIQKLVEKLDNNDKLKKYHAARK